MVCGLFDLRSVLWSIEAQKGRRSPSTFPELQILEVPGNLQFLILFFTSFFNNLGVPFGPAFCLKIWSTRIPKQHEESSRKIVEKNVIWECSKPRKLGPRAGESTILGFYPFPEKTQFWSGFGPSFFKFCELYSQKTRFLGRSENCLVFESIFNAFWTPKMNQKSMKNRSSGSSWAKMAPRRCHLEPTWLQEPILTDF